jgi:hypothetical protein
MESNSPLRNFDPRRIAHYAKENYVAYYRRDWLKLLRALIGMVKETFGLSLWQAIYGAYLMARAEIAFAPYPNNSVARAEEYAGRFYALVKKSRCLRFDVAEAARREVHWWGVHRQLFGNPKNEELVDVLTDLCAFTFELEPAEVRPDAFHRAQGMLYSDRWVQQDKQPNSPLWSQEEQELCESYVALQRALS